MTEKITQTRQVAATQAGSRVDQVASELFSEYSRARLQAWIRKGCLTLDGARAKPKQKVYTGQVLKLVAIQELESEVLAQPIALEVVFEDEHILVLNKPAGLVVHPAAGNRDGTLQNGLLHFDPQLAAIPRSGIVHRLDKLTSGVMVVARSLQAHASLVGQLQDRSMSRIYEAVVTGHPPRKGTIDQPIGRNKHDRQRMAVVPSGRPATSHYEVLKKFRNHSHVRVSLQSGRTHQIRVHMLHLGYPLVGDPQYGRKAGGQKDWPQAVRDAVAAFPRQALHARQLSLVHPISKEHRVFEVPLPEDMRKLLDTLAREEI